MAAEFVGTFALVFIGPLSVAATAGDSSFGRLVFVAAVFGGVVAGSIMALGRISGSYINPAVALGDLVRRNLEPHEFAAFAGVQLAAGLTAGAALRLLFSPEAESAYLGSTSLAATVDPAAGTVLEIAGTFVLAFVAFSVPRLSPSLNVQATIIGSVLLLLIVLLGPYTGASFNPARSVGPAVAAGYFDNLSVYVVGPLVGGSLAGLATRKKSAA